MVSLDDNCIVWYIVLLLKSNSPYIFAETRSCIYFIPVFLLSNAVYGIYNTSNEKIAELVTNNDAYAISDYLPSLGEFYLKEITPSKGYELDNNKYPFVVDKNNLLASVKVYEKVIDSNLTIFKVYASDKTGVLTPEPNITFDIYLKSCFGKSTSYGEISSANVETIFEQMRVHDASDTGMYGVCI